MQRVFVTGASSELMRSVLSDFSENEYQIIALSRTKNDDEGNISWVKGDLNDPRSYSDYLEKVDVIIHAAAITHSRAAEEYFRINLDGTKHLIEEAQKHGNPRFVFISSRTATKESGAYGESKLQAEQLVKAMTESWLILRPAEVYGGNKGEGIDGAIASAIQGGIQPCPIGLASKMYPIHTKDAAKAISTLIRNQARDNAVEYINGPEALSFKELLKLVGSETNRKVMVFPVPKFLMKIAAWLSGRLNINLGFAPDQVDRLYCKKQQGAASATTISVHQYVRKLIQKGTL